MYFIDFASFEAKKNSAKSFQIKVTCRSGEAQMSSSIPMEQFDSVLEQVTSVMGAKVGMVMWNHWHSTLNSIAYEQIVRIELVFSDSRPADSN